MNMFQYLKDKLGEYNQLKIKVNYNSNRLHVLESKLKSKSNDIENLKIQLLINGVDFNIYDEDFRVHKELIREAFKRGYYDFDSVFESKNHSWAEGATFRHNPSYIASNYRYDIESQTLWIPVLGVNHASSCCTSIYSKGVWANIKRHV